MKLKDKYWLSHPNKATLNKLIVLDKAKNFGLRVPNWEIINSKENLIKFKDEHTRIITKSMDSASYLNTKSAIVLFYTKEILEEHISILPTNFPSSFCQQYIDKKFEIRVFFLDNKMYSMAIMTNDDIDYRKRTLELRRVPFKLPIVIKESIRALMQDLELNTGSIDLIYGKDGMYYFLEINPVGQFGMVSEPCNYYLERKVALNLSNA